ncbi:protein NKG7-like [Xenopus laevis]|uniref:Protein NKG7-like n=1 Tax=Xenopus laevis TaxID=8355 RepID=A0A8J1LAX4_XENLA|nr:protein NKG7-like [Xenopus laevis]
MLCSRVLGIILSCASLIFIFTGLLTDYWLVNFGTNLFHSGLWQICTKNICQTIQGSGFIGATRGLVIISVALLLFGMVSVCLSFNNLSMGRITASLLAAMFKFLAAIFLLVGMSVYTGETVSSVNNGSLNYQWSFYLCWVAVFTLILSGVCNIVTHQAAPEPGYEAV